MNLINILCCIFLATYACASSIETLTISTESTTTSTTDGNTTDTTPYETSTDTSDSSSDAPDTTEDSFSDSITSTNPSYDVTSITETEIATETTTDVPEETTKIPGIVDPSLIPRGNFGTDDGSPKPLEPSSDDEGHELEMPEEKATDVGKKNLINTISPSILTTEDSDERYDSEILKGKHIDVSGTGKSMKNTDAGHASETLEGDDIDVSSTEESITNPDAGNKSKVSKGKAAGILVSSCILAVALIWISKIVYTRYQSRTYDVRHGIEMRNP